MNPSLDAGNPPRPFRHLRLAERRTPDRITSQVPVHSVLVQKSVTTITNFAGRLSGWMLGKAGQIRKRADVKSWHLACLTSRGAGYNDGVKSRIMYIESKAESLNGPARVGRVTFSRTLATLYYKGQSFQSLKGSGFKANYRDVESGEKYWISGPRRDGTDRLYVSNIPVEIDPDVREEYWTEIIKKPKLKHKTHT
jgi:hypothetical protein